MSRPPQPDRVSLSTQIMSSADDPRLIRVTITDLEGHVILDTLSSPLAINNKTLLATSIDMGSFDNVRQKCAAILQDKVIVGFRLWDSLQALQIIHSAKDTRDVGTYVPLIQSLPENPELEVLVQTHLGHTIGQVGVSSLENARAGIDLYRAYMGDWETLISTGNWPSLLPPASYLKWYV